MPDLAEMLRGYNDALVPPTDIDEIRQRPPSRSSRRVAFLVVAAAAVIALVVTSVIVLGRDDEPSSVHSIDRPALDGAPPQIVAVDETGGESRLALFDTMSGRRVRHLTSQQPGGGVGAPLPAPDGRSVYVTRGFGSCASGVDRVALSGPAEEPLIPFDESAAQPTPSSLLAANATAIAYDTSTCDHSQTNTLHVRDLGASVDTSYPLAAGEASTDASFSPDGSTLAVVMSTSDESASQVRQRVVMFDVQPHALSERSTIGSDCGDLALMKVAFLGDGRLVLACIDSDDGQLHVETINPMTGETLETLFTTERTDGFNLSVSPDGWFIYRIDSGIFVWHAGRRTRLALDRRSIEWPTWMPRPSEAVTATTYAGLDIGPLLDRKHLKLPERGIAVALGESDVMIFVTEDGRVVGHLNGVRFTPTGMSNALAHGGALQLAIGNKSARVVGGRLEATRGSDGTQTLANGAVVAETDPQLVAADGTAVHVQFGEEFVSSDGGWFTSVTRDGDSLKPAKSIAYDTRTGKSLELDPGCWIAADSSAGRATACQGEMRIVRNGLSTTAGSPPPLAAGSPTGAAAGHWLDASWSPDGETLVATWSGECESISAWFIDARTGRVSLAGPPADVDWESGVMGWRRDGRALVYFGPGICGTALPAGPGVYAVSLDGRGEPVYRVPSYITAWSAGAWTSLG